MPIYEDTIGHPKAATMKTSIKRLIFFLTVVIACLSSASALEATFTPAPDKDTFGDYMWIRL